MGDCVFVFRVEDKYLHDMRFFGQENKMTEDVPSVRQRGWAFGGASSVVLRGLSCLAGQLVHQACPSLTNRCSCPECFDERWLHLLCVTSSEESDGRMGWPAGGMVLGSRVETASGGVFPH